MEAALRFRVEIELAEKLFVERFTGIVVIPPPPEPCWMYDERVEKFCQITEERLVERFVNCPELTLSTFSVLMKATWAESVLTWKRERIVELLLPIGVESDDRPAGVICSSIVIELLFCPIGVESVESPEDRIP